MRVGIRFSNISISDCCRESVCVNLYDHKFLTMNYGEIMDYINRGYKPLRDLELLLAYRYLNNNEKYKIWLFERKSEKLIDVNGANMVEEYIPERWAFGKAIQGHFHCYPTDRNYLADE